MVDSELMQNGGLQVMYVYGFFGDVYAVVVGLAVSDATLYAAAGEPVSKAIRVMIAPVILFGEFALTINCTAEFAAPDNERVIKHAALFEIAQERGGALICIAALRGHAFGGITVGIPSAMIKLDEPHAALSQAACKQTIVGVAAGFGGVGAVHIEHALGFALGIDEFGHAHLHTKRQFVLRDTRGDGTGWLGLG